MAGQNLTKIGEKRIFGPPKKGDGPPGEFRDAIFGSPGRGPSPPPKPRRRLIGTDNLFEGLELAARQQGGLCTRPMHTQLRGNPPPPGLRQIAPAFGHTKRPSLVATGAGWLEVTRAGS